MNLYVPIAIIVLSNTCYHIIAKSSPTDINTFASLSITYFIASITCLVFYFVSNKQPQLFVEYQKLNWTSFALGVAVVGLEVGALLMYKVGWNISVGHLVASTILSIGLIFIGLLLFKESVSLKQVFGIVLCLIGLIFINK